MIQIGKRLRRHRENMNLTREEFAEKANISPQFLAEIENGKKGRYVCRHSLQNMQKFIYIC